MRTGCKIVLGEVKQSIFIRWMIRNGRSLLLSVCISVFLTILSYPGILYTDSYSRISFADSLGMSIHAFWSGDAGLTTASSWLTVVPSFFILLSKEIVGSIVLYTFIQSLSFWFFSFAFFNQLNENTHPVWNKICLVFSPVMWAYSVYYEAGVGCATAIMIMLILVWKWNKIQTKFDKLFFVLALTFAAFICFGYRANAFSILPALLVIVLIKERKFFSRTIILCSIFVGFAISFIVPGILNINPRSSYSAGFAWEIVSMVQSMDSEKQADYIDCLDDLFGEGATAAAVQINTYDEQDADINSMFLSPINAAALSGQGVSTEIIKRYVKFAVDEPAVFFKVKWEFISHTLGINKPINLFEYHYDRGNRMNDFGFNNSVQRKQFVNFFLAFMEFSVVFRTPWILYLICLVLILVWRFRFKGKKTEMNFYEATYVISLFYYGCYLLNTQSFEFRYFFPSWIMLIGIIVGLTSQMLLGNRKTKTAAVGVLALIILLSFAGGYKDYTKAGNELLVKVKAEGTLVYEDIERSVYYRDNKLYFLTSRHSDNTYEYFLRFYPIEGEIISNDFEFKSVSIPTSISKECIAEIAIPIQHFSTIEFGQHYCETQFWEYSFVLEDVLNCPTQIELSNMTDEKWENGHSRTENVILIDNNNSEYYLLIGKYLLSPSGARYLVTDVKQVEGYSIIFTDNHFDDYSVNSYEVAEK